MDKIKKKEKLDRKNPSIKKVVIFMCSIKKSIRVVVMDSYLCLILRGSEKIGEFDKKVKCSFWIFVKTCDCKKVERRKGFKGVYKLIFGPGPLSSD